jgi:RHH-type rel operon transcriptional repressor/antitoxin RelB
MITIDLSPEIENHFDELARKAGRTPESCAKEALLDYLQDLEDYFDAKAQMEEIEAGHAKTMPLKDMMKHYGMDN